VSRSGILAGLSRRPLMQQHPRFPDVRPGVDKALLAQSHLSAAPNRARHVNIHRASQVLRLCCSHALRNGRQQPMTGSWAGRWLRPLVLDGGGWCASSDAVLAARHLHPAALGDLRSEHRKEYCRWLYSREHAFFRIYDAPALYGARAGLLVRLLAPDILDGLCVGRRSSSIRKGAAGDHRQFITSSEDKWKRLPGKLRMLLRTASKARVPAHCRCALVAVSPRACALGKHPSVLNPTRRRRSTSPAAAPCAAQL